MPSVEGLGARKAALQMLDAVLRRGLTLDSAAQAVRGLSPQDKALAIAIGGEVLRRLPDLDTLIDSATKRPLPDDAKARMVLRLALVQVIALGTPEHAAVATALPLVDGGPRRLVHGVLGTLLRRGLPALDSPRLPETVEQRWSARWGDEVVAAARRVIAQRPPLDLTFKQAGDAQAFVGEHGGTSLASGNVRVAQSTSVTELPGFGSGKWWVQDLAASLPGRLMPGGQLLDLCAAPGGKTMQLAAAGARVTAVDSSKSRLARLSENLQRTGLEAELVVADARQWQPGRTFDAILLDAPCSATGTFRRQPEVLYRATARIIAESREQQAQLLERASGWLKPAGTLVYSVCSLEPEEGEQVIAAFLAAHPEFKAAPPTPGELPEFVTPTPEGFVRILPGLLEAEGGLDGFFVARLVRAG